MRVCPACHAEVGPLFDIDGTDHWVLAEKPMRIELLDGGFDRPGDRIRISVEQDVRIMRCSELRRVDDPDGILSVCSVKPESA